VLQIN